MAFANKLQTFGGSDMRLLHIIKRGKRYHYVCRIPADLQHLFPSASIYKSLRTDNFKHARLLASAEEYRLQQLFVQLRSGMLSKDYEKHLIASYIKHHLSILEAKATGTTNHCDNPAEVKAKLKKEDLFFDLFAESFDLPDDHIRQLKLEFYRLLSVKMTDMIANRDASEWPIIGKISNLSKTEQKALEIKVLNANKQIFDAECSMYAGDWGPMESLREKAERDLAVPFCSFELVIAKYKEYYLAEKPHVKLGTIDDMHVECRVLLEIIGNISIAEVNSLGTVTKLKKILQRYPKNKEQRYSEKSIHSILRTEKGYEVISLKTANEYLKRLKAIIDFAVDSEIITSSNKVGRYFQTETAEEDQRSAYDSNDIEHLIDAICTQKLWLYNPPKPERFWVVLIALFHGLRLGNILALTKEDIVQTDSGMWLLVLRQGKTKATVRPVAICDCLLLLGFLEWVETVPRKKLFQDSTDSFSKWYNRDEKRADGYEIKGFESKFVTADKKKCLYSIRHSFAGNVFDVTTDYKITADMMGHSTGRSITARYTKRTKAQALKEISDKMDLQHIDLDRLEKRAIELFSV